MSSIRQDVYLVWIRSPRGVSPQKLYAEPDKAPFIDEGIRGHVVGAPIKLDVYERRMSLGLLERLLTAPAIPPLE